MSDLTIEPPTDSSSEPDWERMANTDLSALDGWLEDNLPSGFTTVEAYQNHDRADGLRDARAILTGRKTAVTHTGEKVESASRAVFTAGIMFAGVAAFGPALAVSAAAVGTHFLNKIVVDTACGMLDHSLMAVDIVASPQHTAVAHDAAMATLLDTEKMIKAWEDTENAAALVAKFGLGFLGKFGEAVLTIGDIVKKKNATPDDTTPPSHRLATALHKIDNKAHATPLPM